MKLKNNQAFSLIELSIVIIIIGILIAGVVQGKSLIAKSRLSAARTLTNSSPVSGIKNLVFWVETTSAKSFYGNDLNVDSPEINTWHDINPTTTDNNNLESQTAINPPIYQEKGIGGLPSLYFNATADGSSGSLLGTEDAAPTMTSSEFSIFVVAEHQEETTSYRTVVSARSAVSATHGYILWRPSAAETWSGWYTTVAGWEPASKPIEYYKPAILSMYYKNGSLHLSKNGDTPVTSTYDYRTVDSDNIGKLFIGATTDDSVAAPSGFFDGLISEIIIYDRGLKNPEIEEIENYLSQKYGIGLE